MQKLLASLILSALMTTPLAAKNGEWVEWIADAQGAYTSIDNLNLSAFEDSHADEYLALNALVGRFYQFNGFTRMNIAFDIAVEKFQEFDLLDSNQFGANIGIRHKFGLGFYQPYLQFNFDYLKKDIKWDANSIDIAFTRLEVGKHITNQLSLAASIDFTSTQGEAGAVIVPEISANVFDQRYFHLSLFVDYIISEQWLITASYARRQGEFQSSCNKANVAKVLEVEEVKAITNDDIFGGCVYKLDGGSNIYLASLSYSLTSHAAVNFVMEHYQGQADVLDYHSTSYLISFNYRY